MWCIFHEIWFLRFGDPEKYDGDSYVQLKRICYLIWYKKWIFDKSIRLTCHDTIQNVVGNESTIRIVYISLINFFIFVPFAVGWRYAI